MYHLHIRSPGTNQLLLAYIPQENYRQIAFFVQLLGLIAYTLEYEQLLHRFQYGNK
jgi:hypothetical protein